MLECDYCFASDYDCIKSQKSRLKKIKILQYKPEA